MEDNTYTFHPDFSPDVNVTDSAAKRIGFLCEQHNKIVRLSVLSGGCNGYTKSFDLVETVEDDDLEIQFFPGTLVIDSVSLEFLNGSTIDYKVDLSGAYFAVEIPTATSSCGCGQSFAV